MCLAIDKRDYAISLHKLVGDPNKFNILNEEPSKFTFKKLDNKDKAKPSKPHGLLKIRK